MIERQLACGCVVLERSLPPNTLGLLCGNGGGLHSRASELAARRRQVEADLNRAKNSNPSRISALNGELKQLTEQAIEALIEMLHHCGVDADWVEAHLPQIGIQFGIEQTKLVTALRKRQAV